MFATPHHSATAKVHVVKQNSDGSYALHAAEKEAPAPHAAALKTLEEINTHVYDTCANFKQSRFSSISDHQLFKYRMMMGVAYYLVLGVSAVANTSNPWAFWYYESSWGMLASTISLTLTIIAAEHKLFQRIAVIIFEMAMCMDLIIGPVFNIFLAPMIFPGMPKDNAFDILLMVRMFLIHSLPIIFTSINLYLSDVAFPKQDTYIIAFFCVMYGWANSTGVLNMKSLVEPGFNFTPANV